MCVSDFPSCFARVTHTGGEDAGGCLVEVERSHASHTVCYQRQDITTHTHRVTTLYSINELNKEHTGTECVDESLRDSVPPETHISPPFREMTILSEVMKAA